MFNVGDKARVTNIKFDDGEDNLSSLIGKVGVVIDITGGSLPVVVDFGPAENGPWGLDFYPSELELADV